MTPAVASGHMFAAVTIFRYELTGPDAFRVFPVPDGRPGVFHDIAHFLFKPGLAGDHIAVRFNGDVILRRGAAFDPEAQFYRVQAPVTGGGIPL